MKVTIVNYGLGNLWSVKNAFEFMGAEVIISADPAVVLDSEALVLPGVGNFGRGMQNLHERGLVDALNNAVNGNGAPILGICLGMHLLAEQSEEAPGVSGLSWIPGQVRKFADKTLRLPHMGFNAVSASSSTTDISSPLFEEDSDFYFVHSYCFEPKNINHVLALTTYGAEFVSAVRKGNIFGVQFHPEKSQSSGLQLIGNFLRFCEKKSYG
jgi:glutamine amidotransferase